ncbi:hypothetical protein [Chondromyces apiculatus]|uniref:Uncharacterized protein n=1 Tax=Chondromyces apiculatus DSM 436 TaxID=1192034 RepID=A0A017SV75_9BACT|nr:hypothetical protein [Chondromyces apiculatus]EYF00652.1 Hypothetical protein CAP_0405 [Chondromyces apiculatus DSM 436]
MTKRLIRFARRAANWEGDVPVKELQRMEFRTKDGGPDLRPSVYELERVPESLPQTYAEHAHHIDPPRQALAIDVIDGTRPVQATPGKQEFAFIRDRHREVMLRDEYARQRLQEGDPEWNAVVEAPDAKPWLRKLKSS